MIAVSGVVERDTQPGNADNPRLSTGSVGDGVVAIWVEVIVKIARTSAIVNAHPRETRPDVVRAAPLAVHRIGENRTRPETSQRAGPVNVDDEADVQETLVNERRYELAFV